MEIKLSTLAVLLGLALGLPQIYGLMKPASFAAGVRKFSRSLPWGIALMLLGTAWFLYYFSLEFIFDFASYQSWLLAWVAGVGVSACFFVQGFLAGRWLRVG